MPQVRPERLHRTEALRIPQSACCASGEAALNADAAAWETLRTALDERIGQLSQYLRLAPSTYADDAREWEVRHFDGTHHDLIMTSS